MKTLQFKTNINCSGCIANISVKLNKEKEIKTWEVDITNPGKILTVQTEQFTEQQVIEVVNKAGFKAEKIQSLKDF